MSPLAALRRYARPAQEGAEAGPRCELCAAAIGEAHRHVAELESRTIACACDACALLFSQPGAGGGRHRTVPDRVRHDPSFVLDDARWSELGIPVRLAFFLRSSSAGGWVAFYPGPAGTTESALPDEAWRALSRAPLARAAAEDVEAILAWGPRGATRFECLLVPVTRCYELTAILRRQWRGFDGGDDARRELERCFEALRARSLPLREGERA